MVQRFDQNREFRQLALTGGDVKGTNVTAATVAEAPGAILFKMAEANGRPVSFVLVGPDSELPADGDRVPVDTPLVQRSLNHFMLRQGLAYYTVYSSLPKVQRQVLRDEAVAARNAAAANPGSRSEDDRVIIGDVEVVFSDLILRANNIIMLHGDVLDFVFIEK